MHTVTVRNVTIGEGIPKICVPVVGITKKEIKEQAELAKQSGADIVEWRADWFADVCEPQSVAEVLKELRGTLGELPLLFTFRTKREGGERELSLNAYLALNEAAARSGLVDLVDIELFAGDECVKRLVETSHSYGVKVVASNHDFQKTPAKDEIIKRLCRMQELGADIVKIAVMPESRADVLMLLAATEEMCREYARCPVITMSMGSDGVLSRLCGELTGCAVTFGAVGKVSAPGQVQAQELAAVLRLLHQSML